MSMDKMNTATIALKASVATFNTADKVRDGATLSLAIAAIVHLFNGGFASDLDRESKAALVATKALVEDAKSESVAKQVMRFIKPAVLSGRYRRDLLVRDTPTVTNGKLTVRFKGQAWRDLQGTFAKSIAKGKAAKVSAKVSAKAADTGNDDRTVITAEIMLNTLAKMTAAERVTVAAGLAKMTAADTKAARVTKAAERKAARVTKAAAATKAAVQAERKAARAAVQAERKADVALAAAA